MVYMREGLKRVRVVASIYYNNSTLRDHPYIRTDRALKSGGFICERW
jgi:hypothetical protein